ncbi:MAG: ArsR/SmtB family transcription factor [Acidimicrobiales bacterium]
MSEVFVALSDPNRRRIVEWLISREFATATVLAAELQITRQAVARHLGLLEAVGLAESTKVGRETRFTARVEPLDDVNSWVVARQREWSGRLDLMRDALDEPCG